MNVLIVGTGSIGCTIGACLLSSGKDVYFLSRGNNFKLFSEKPLLTSGEIETGSFNLNISDRIENFPEPDLVILAVKSQDIVQAAKKILPALKKETIVLTIQDGMETEELLKPLLGEHLVGGLTYITAELNANRLHVTGNKKTLICELNNQKSERVAKLADFLNTSGIDTIITDDFLTEKWIKLEWNCAFNSISAVEEMTVKEILSNSETRARAVKLMIEVARTGKAEGIRFPDNLINLFLKDSFDMDFKTSMLKDKEKRKQLEYEAINGFLIRTAEKHKIRVPENLKIYNQIKLMINDG